MQIFHSSLISVVKISIFAQLSLLFASETATGCDQLLIQFDLQYKDAQKGAQTAEPSVSRRNISALQ